MSKQRPARRRCAAVVPAAGESVRMGGISKILTPVNGLPLVGYTLRALESCRDIDEIIVAARDCDVIAIAKLCKELGLTKVTKVLRGGATRSLSVLTALMETSADIVAVHDGARPCVTPALCSSVIHKAAETGAAIPGTAVTDSVKYADAKKITGTVDRSKLFAVQTPQCFDAGLLKGALAKALQEGLDITDDSAAVEALPFPVSLVAGDSKNIKVTTADDLLLAAALLREGTSLCE